MAYDYQVKYNSVEWYSTYGFLLSPNGLNNRFGWPRPRDDGYDEIPTVDYPYSVGPDSAVKQIQITGSIIAANHATLTAMMVTFSEALYNLRQAGEFKELYFHDTATSAWWMALPMELLTMSVASNFNSVGEIVTVTFDTYSQIQTS